MKKNIHLQVDKIGEVLTVDPYKSSVSKINRIVCVSDKKKVAIALSICRTVLTEPEIAMNSYVKERIAVMKVVLGLIPHSMVMIEELIRNMNCRKDFEIHFTLFVYMDSLFNISGTKAVRQKIALLLRDYLMHVRRETALAPWMAADLLGDHWGIRESLPILIETAQKARYVAGREAAVTGLKKAMKRCENRPASRSRVLSLLSQIANEDKSETVRLSAKIVLGLV